MVTDSVREIIDRASLHKFPVQEAIVKILGDARSLSAADLRASVCDLLDFDVTSTTIERGIAHTNERLRLIDNSDPRRRLCAAQISEIVVEVGGLNCTHYALVRT